MTVDVTIDQFPLEYIPPVTDAITDLRGTAIGRIAARGTIKEPRLVGALEIGRGHVRLAPLGVSIANMSAALRMAGDSIVIDSLVGSSGGRIYVDGGIGLASLTEPSFDLELTARNAQVLDNDQGNARIDADLAMRGPFNAVYINGQATVLNAVYYIPESDNKKVIGPGDPALFARANALVAHGLPTAVVGQHCLASARAAGSVVALADADPSLRAVTSDPARAEALLVAVELATTAFRTALTTRLSGD